MEGRLCFSSQFKGMPINHGREGVSSSSCGCKRIRRQQATLRSCLSLLIQSTLQPVGQHCKHLWGDPYRCAYRCVSQVILNPVNLTKENNPHNKLHKFYYVPQC